MTVSTAVDEDGGLPNRVPSDVQNQFLCFAEVEGEVVYLAPHCQSAYLLLVGRLVIVGNLLLSCCQRT